MAASAGLCEGCGRQAADFLCQLPRHPRCRDTLVPLAGRDGMRSSVMTLNGVELVAGAKGELPELSGVKVSGQVEISPGSCAFVIV